MLRRSASAAGRTGMLLALACAGALLGPSSALAARTWYVTPNGVEVGSCTQPEPCNLKDLVEEFTLALAPGDTVMLAGNAGTYGSAGTPIGFTITVPEGVTFTGTPGQPMPKIYSRVKNSAAFRVEGSNSVLADVDVEDSGTEEGGWSTLLGRFTEVNRVIARSTTHERAACSLYDVTITDSLCAGKDGFYMSTAGALPQTIVLRNTIIDGSEYGMILVGTSKLDLKVSAVNTIVRGGTKADIFTDPVGKEDALQVTLEHSNYATIEQEGEGKSTVTAPGMSFNQTAAPLFINAAAGDFHEAAGSPTIDAGTDSALNGPLDLEGNPRQIGLHTDIGAYEFLIAPSALTTAATGVGQTTATLTGTVNPNGLAASFHFVYGTTSAYGSTTTAAGAGSGTSPTGVSAALTGLAPNTTYHYQVLASNSVGPASGADQTFTTSSSPGSSAPLATMPSLSGLRVSPSSFRVASSGPTATSAKTKTKPKRKTGATVSYSLNEAALVNLTIQASQPGRRGKSGACVKPSRANRHAKSCKRSVRLGGFTKQGSAGADRFHFTGRLNGHPLSRGSYTLMATPSAPGGAGKAETASFRIIT